MVKKSEENKELTTADAEKEIALNEAKLKQLTDKVLTGKCPVKVFERDGKINWEYPILRDGFKEISDAFKHLAATTDFELARSIISQAVMATVGADDATKYNIVMQTLADFEPKDAVESKLVLQSHALYTNGMKYLSLAETSEKAPNIDFYLKNATKLLRLHNETIEALGKYRRGGTQNVIVQHVQVNDGGQAVVGGVLTGGGIK